MLVAIHPVDWTLTNSDPHSQQQSGNVWPFCSTLVPYPVVCFVLQILIRSLKIFQRHQLNMETHYTVTAKRVPENLKTVLVAVRCNLFISL